MEQYAVARADAGEAGAIEPEIGRALRRIAEGEPAQNAVALDSMQVTADAVPLFVEYRGQRLADAREIVTVTPPPRGARNQCGAKKTLGIDDIVVSHRTNAAQTFGDLAQGRRRIERLSPAPPRNWDDIAHGRMEVYEWRECFLNKPGKGRVRPCLAGIDKRRHMVDHIAERRCLDEKDVGHDAFVALIYRSLRRAAITMPAGAAIRLLLRSGTLPHG